MFLKKYNLKNKIALVTGAGKGLGKACAIALAEAGANLIIISRTKKDLDQVSKIIKKFKVKCKSYICDITNYNEIKEIINKQSRIDVLINNAGTNIPEYFTKVKRQNMEYLVKINTITSFNIAQLCTLKMIKAKNRRKVGGSIVNMSSQMGHVSGPKRSVYSMNKFGLEGLTKGMSLDLAKFNIRVNTIHPDCVYDTNVWNKKIIKERAKQYNLSIKDYKERNLLKTEVSSLDVAELVVFFASTKSNKTTGAQIPIDGGNDRII